MIYLLLYVIVVSITSFSMKIVLKTVSPVQLTIFMAVGMLVIAVPMVFMTNQVAISRNSWIAASLVGVGMALGTLFYVLALKDLPLGFAIVVSHIYIPIVVVLSVIFLHEKLSISQLIGLVMALVGVSLLVTKA